MLVLDGGIVPTATLVLNGQKREVCFDLNRLVAIEEATGQSVYEVLTCLVDLYPKPSGHRINVNTGKEEPIPPTPEEVMKSLSRGRISWNRKFVAGCLDVPEKELAGIQGFRSIFFALAGVFADAVIQMSGDQDDAAGKPSAQPGTSEPGLASI